MNRADRKSWQAARTLADLGELTAQWLEGSIRHNPGYPGGGPDPETTELVPTLAATNRAGYLTDCSQPGHGPTPGYDGRLWRQRAAVSGVTTPELADHLQQAATSAGLTVIRHTSPSRWRTGYANTVAVTRAGQDNTCGFGARLSRRDLAWVYGGECNQVALDAIRRSHQVSLIDPVWGRNTVLWPLLDDINHTRSAA